MTKEVSPCVRPLDQCPTYEQDEPGIAVFRWVLEKGEIDDLTMGFVTLEGPIHKTPGAHDEWDQVYLVFAGGGTVHLDDKTVEAVAPAAVVIPRGVRHSIEVPAGEKIQYVFVNKF
ncbi:MAG: cupin domain-containing protein [Planctomycetes bacterium]|nr:cupin domain-containing protein [Planctomycetota bacterium]